MKVCPVCKSRCFDDMDTCYGCLHKFNTSATQVHPNISPQQNRHIPQYFEIEDNVDKYLMLEDVNDFLERRAAQLGVDTEVPRNLVSNNQENVYLDCSSQIEAIDTKFNKNKIVLEIVLK